MELSPNCRLDLPSFEKLEDSGDTLFPLVEQCELPSISADILKATIAGERIVKEEIVIIDFRHYFEYQGGHIKGALYLSDPSSIEQFYRDHLDKGKKTAVIFYCEFSSARAPKLFRHMRNLDRHRHLEAYPALGFPHMFLLHGGYKTFFDLYPDLCEPKNYTRMVDPSYAEDLRQATRVHKRSWSRLCRKTSKAQSNVGAVLSDMSNLQEKAQVVRRSCSTCLSFNK